MSRDEVESKTRVDTCDKCRRKLFVIDRQQNERPYIELMQHRYLRIYVRDGHIVNWEYWKKRKRDFY